MQSNDLTILLAEWSKGNEKVLEQLIPIVYQELHKIAVHKINQERFNNTLQATALINEAYIRLVNWQNVNWQNRAHFFSVSAQIMRNILVEQARSQLSAKRGSRQTIYLSEVSELAGQTDVDLVALDECLKTLAKMDAQQSRIIELRYFGGLTIEETAEILKCSQATVKREWNMAKAWLLRELSKV